MSTFLVVILCDTLIRATNVRAVIIIWVCNKAGVVTHCALMKTFHLFQCEAFVRPITATSPEMGDVTVVRKVKCSCLFHSTLRRISLNYEIKVEYEIPNRVVVLYFFIARVW